MSDGVQMVDPARAASPALRRLPTNVLKKELRRLRTVHDVICERGDRLTKGVQVRDDILAIRDELARRGVDSSQRALPAHRAHRH
jgi:hypothetical protein